MKCLANSKTVGRQMSKEINRIANERTKLGLKYFQAANTLTLLDGGYLTAEQVIEFTQKADKLFTEITEGYLNFEDILETLKTEYGFELKINIT